MEHVNKLSYITKSCFTCVLLCIFYSVNAQQPTLFTQYLDNPIIINPAYTGNRNSLAIDLRTRQQWMGFKDAPTTYYASTHSPINKTKASVGGYILSDRVAPIINNNITGAYSYLLRLNHNAFISLGVNGGVDIYGINLNEIAVIDQTDPHFAKNIKNKIKPSFGTGAVLFTPTFYLGFSVPQLIPSKIDYPEADASLDFGYNLYFTAGIKKELNNGFAAKFATIARISQNYVNSYDLSIQFFYKDYINLAASYRVKNSVALIIGTQVSKNIGVSYSYDFPVSGNNINNINSQELTISIDISKYFERNRDREFLRGPEKESDPSLRSIRHF